MTCPALIQLIASHHDWLAVDHGSLAGLAVVKIISKSILTYSESFLMAYFEA